ncbi:MULTISPECIES: TetR/AcrR family transcriptional regulator [Vibrio]|uniref:TetR family transcriptional regulator n=2 Tax=Vibrio TaxID=662 RepID=A0A7X4LJQ9_9VIBR|nr:MULTISPECIES: TetR/AcrR family transcriptional regulator [Vibrio]MBF9003352.1 TetR/AcrR family transcriptional regulator [Vibrio nitrifigilis]MZI93116.1 TetR family transcriptional regulator [Vibrio eleionomae]
MNSKTLDTKQHIISTGYQLVSKKGFTGVGLSELLKTAEVPKGSFYHYFDSKEQFGEALLQDYFEQYLQSVASLFNSAPGNYYQNLMRYWHYWVEHNSVSAQSNKCLVVKLAGEVSDLSESMRLVLLKGTNRVITQLSDYIKQGVEAKELHVSNCSVTAEYLYEFWIGASLIAKIRQDDASLNQALEVTEQILKGQNY